jgi:hypothetical protein
VSADATFEWSSTIGDADGSIIAAIIIGAFGENRLVQLPVTCYGGSQLERVRSARVRLPNAFVNKWWEVYFYGRRNR